jgi:hypothetical protein
VHAPGAKLPQDGEGNGRIFHLVDAQEREADIQSGRVSPDSVGRTGDRRQSSLLAAK